MAHESIIRIAIAAPITAAAFDSKHHILYAGSGGQLLCYRNVGEQFVDIEVIEVGPYDIFTAHTIHGIKCVDCEMPKVVAFGGKGVCVATIQQDRMHLSTPTTHKFVVELLLEDLDDLVLDCVLTESILLIGFAHNFIDVMMTTLPLHAPNCIYRIQCPDVSALFSLSIAMSNDHLLSQDCKRMLVASGTAFGKIILWSFNLPAIDTANRKSFLVKDIPNVTIDDALTNHEGVIFRLQWSRDRRKIASVSDDRTVRVWNIPASGRGYQIFVGWGHISRLWDVIFLGDLEDRVATCSEDGTIKIWDLKKDICAVTLRGHSSDIWCLTSANLSCYTKATGCVEGTENLILFSGGNDGSVKSWSVNAHSIACPEDPAASTIALLMPKIPPDQTLPTTKCANEQTEVIHGDRQDSYGGSASAVTSSSRRSNGVCAVKLDPSGMLGVVFLCEGGVWLVNFASAVAASTVPAAPTKASSASLDGEEGGGKSGLDALHTSDSESDHGRDRGWSFLINLNKGVTNADVVFSHSCCDSVSEGDHVFLKIFCAHPDGYITSLNISPQSSGPSYRFYFSCAMHHTSLLVERKAWKAHQLRAINVWHLGDDIDIKNAQENIIPSTEKQLLFTSSVKGVCRLWEESTNDTAPYNLLFECVTAKNQIATCCAILKDNSLVIGDSRGGISIFRWDDSIHKIKVPATSHLDPSNGFISEDYQQLPIQDEGPANSQCRLPADLYIPHAHGSDLVSSIKENRDGGGFYSVGHDGFFCIFTSTGSLMNKLKCLPIKSPDKIFIVGKGKEKSIYIGGFLGGLYLVYDIRRGYQLMRIEGGGWKRPHHALLSVQAPRVLARTGSQSASWSELPRVVFICPAPLKDETALMFCDSLPIIFSSATTAPSATQPSNTPSIKHFEASSSPQSVETAVTTSSFSAGIQNVPLHLGTQSHGKVSYCAKIIPFSREACHESSHNLVTGAGITENIFSVVGGEDGSIKIFSCLKNTAASLSSRDVEEEEVLKKLPTRNSTFNFLQEVNMPGNVAVKAVSTASRRAPRSRLEETKSGGIIVAVGGRLTYSIWEYSLQDIHRNAEDHFGACLSFLTSGSIDQKSSQDHRILSVQCTLLPAMNIKMKIDSTLHERSGFLQAASLKSHLPETEDTMSADVYLVVMGDSRGRVTIATYVNDFRINDIGADVEGPRMPHRKNRLDFIDEFNATTSGCPILSCDVLVLRSKFEVTDEHTEVDTEEKNRVVLLLGLFGDTAGFISVWLLSGSVLLDQTQTSGCTVLHKSRPLFSYKAHAMGANTLSSIETCFNESINQPISRYSGDHKGSLYSRSDPFSWDIFIASGGDDQAITGCSATINFTPLEGGSSLFAITSCHKRADGCSGSAIKGVKVLVLTTSKFCDKPQQEKNVDVIHEKCGNKKDLVIASVGYDQRLAVWRPTRNLLSTDQAKCTQVIIADNSSEAFEQRKNCCDEEVDDDTSENGDEKSGNISYTADLDLARDALLLWVSGATIHVGDVCALDAVLIFRDTAPSEPYQTKTLDIAMHEICQQDDTVEEAQQIGHLPEVDIIIVGEGFQLLTLRL